MIWPPGGGRSNYGYSDPGYDLFLKVFFCTFVIGIVATGLTVAISGNPEYIRYAVGFMIASPLIGFVMGVLVTSILKQYR